MECYRHGWTSDISDADTFQPGNRNVGVFIRKLIGVSPIDGVVPLLAEKAAGAGVGSSGACRFRGAERTQCVWNKGSVCVKRIGNVCALGGDWNMSAQNLAASGWLKANQGVAMTSSSGIFRVASGR